MKETHDSDIIFLKSLGHRIRGLRKNRGISQEQLAELTSLSDGYLSGIENGKRNASITVYRRIADILQVPLPKLFDIDLSEEETKQFLDKALAELSKLNRKEQRILIKTIQGVFAGFLE